MTLRAARLVVFAACLAAESRGAGDEWWREAVFYEVFVRSFADSTDGPLAGDGVGDLRGLTERLDYLNDGDPATTGDLGVTALWLMPICQSPSYHGYDVTDYRRVDEEYGANADFVALVDAAHQRGVRVIVDMVLNHTSDRHPWFRESLDPALPRHDWYVWSPEPIKADWGGELWHKDAKSGLYYFALFWRGMPDLNLRSAGATAEVHDLSRFWLRDLHADGFRLDAARHLIEHWPSVENTDETLDWLRDYRADMKRTDPDAFLVGEVWSGSDQIARYVPDSLDAGFEFDLAFAIVEGVRDGDPARIGRTLEHVLAAYPPGQYATFLANHDMPRTMTTLLAGSKDRAEAQAKLAATIQFALPGIPFIYYGEEIGMTGAKPDPEIRTPMQWTSGDTRGGFTSGRPWHAIQNDSADVNVEKESEDPRSILCRYRDLVRLRREHAALRRGETRLLDTNVPGLLAIERRGGGETVVALFNCSAAPLDCPEGLDAIPARPVVLLGDNPQGFPLPPWGAAILSR